jgi:hypothetical protein
MHPDWKAIEERLDADRTFYEGVLAGFVRHFGLGGSNSIAQQRAAIVAVVERLEDALAAVQARRATGPHSDLSSLPGDLRRPARGRTVPEANTGGGRN